MVVERGGLRARSSAPRPASSAFTGVFSAATGESRPRTTQSQLALQLESAADSAAAAGLLCVEWA